MRFDWLTIAKRLEALAQTGLSYSQNDYDLERYEEIREISHQIFHHYTDDPVENIRNFFSNEKGYPTPKVDVRGVIFRNDKILLIQEKLDHLWALPGGWADIGLSPREVVIKEVREEAGLDVKPDRLLAVFDKNKHGHPPSPLHVYKLMILCIDNGGNPFPGMETLDAGFYNLNELPPLSLERNTTDQLKTLFKLYKNPQALPLID